MLLEYWPGVRSQAVQGVKPWTAPSITMKSLSLFAAMGAHYFIRDNERHYDMAASKDKDFIVIEGAVHGFTPCTACERTPGQYSNSVKNLFDYAPKCINARF